MDGVRQESLGAFDWSFIALYMVGLVGFSVWVSIRKRQNATEYLVAPGSMHWIVVAISVFATLFSTISFVAVPGEAYNYGLPMILASIGQIIFYPLAIWLFLRFFFMAPTFTAYEYLERRFSRGCRTYGAIIFIMIRLFYIGGVFYAAAVIFESLVGWPPLLTIAVVGAITLLYAIVGGIKAVIQAEVLQSLIIFVSIIAILYFILKACGFDVAAVFTYTNDKERLFQLLQKEEFYRLNPHDRWNMWLLIFGLVTVPLTALSCDQLVIQRLLAGKSYQEAKRSTYTSFFVGMPVMILLYVLGLFLYYYYTAASGGGTLPEGTRGDHVMGYFVKTQMPSPFPGLVVIALLSALMSTVAAGVNSLVTVFLKDIVSLVRPQVIGSDKEIVWCYVLMLVFGLLTILVASSMVLLGQSVSTTVLEVVGVWATLWGVLMAVFLYGVASTRVSARAMLVSIPISALLALSIPYIMYYSVAQSERWGFFWVGLPGTVCALSLPYLLPFIWPNRKNIEGLTIYTTKAFIQNKCPEPVTPAEGLVRQEAGD